MRPYISPLSIEKYLPEQTASRSKYAIIDGNGSKLVILDKLYDAAICLRFIIGKSMSRQECDIAQQILKDLDKEESPAISGSSC